MMKKVISILVLTQILLFSLIVSADDLPKAFSSPPKITLSGHGNGKVAVLAMPRADIQQLLPPGLEIGDNPKLPAAQVSISIMMVRHDNLRMLTSAGDLTLVPEYNEVIFAINNVRKTGSKKSYWYFKKLYLDSWPAIIGGWYLAYPKRFGIFDFQESSMVGTTAAGNLISRLDFQPDSEADPAQFSEDFEEIKKSLMLPVIEPGINGWVCSQFVWNFDTAIYFPIKGQLELTHKLNPLIPGSYSFQSLHGSGIGGYSLESDWTLQGPIKCE